jgi:hypothetical protein
VLAPHQLPCLGPSSSVVFQNHPVLYQNHPRIYPTIPTHIYVSMRTHKRSLRVKAEYRGLMEGESVETCRRERASEPGPSAVEASRRTIRTWGQRSSGGGAVNRANACAPDRESGLSVFDSLL